MDLEDVLEGEELAPGSSGLPEDDADLADTPLSIPDGLERSPVEARVLRGVRAGLEPLQILRVFDDAELAAWRADPSCLVCGSSPGDRTSVAFGEVGGLCVFCRTERREAAREEWAATEEALRILDPRQRPGRPEDRVADPLFMRAYLMASKHSLERWGTKKWHYIAAEMTELLREGDPATYGENYELPPPTLRDKLKRYYGPVQSAHRPRRPRRTT